MSRGSILAGMAAGIVLLMAPVPQDTTARIVWNASASVPTGLYWIAPGPVRRGELVLIRLPPPIADLADQRGYLPRSAYLLKFVTGVTGDRVCRFGDRVLVNGAFRARAFARDIQHRHLPLWHGCYRLAASQVFVLAEDPDSFDSRYFGPLSHRHIIGRGVRVW
jgi:conjugative transfer signal peptidase TraF